VGAPDACYITYVPETPTMRTTHRFLTFKEALNFFMNEFSMNNQEATHFIWDNQFKMGTDRAIWITEPTN